jgi:hypothetical protein
MSTGRVTLPSQSRGSQMADAAFLLALLFLTLFVTTYVFTDQGGDGAGSDTTVTAIEELPISEAEKGQFLRMEELEMVDAETVAASVGANAPSEDKYSFSWTALLGTVSLALLYLGFVYAMSFKEYREVVRARFGPPERSES